MTTTKRIVQTAVLLTGLLLLSSGIAYGTSGTDAGFSVGWLTGDVANGTISGSSLNTIVGNLWSNDTTHDTLIAATQVYVNDTFMMSNNATTCSGGQYSRFNGTGFDCYTDTTGSGSGGNNSYTYFVKNNSGTIEAINGDTGTIDYSNSDASTVLNSVYSRGTIFVRKGSYGITSQLTVSGNSTIICETQDTTFLKQFNGVLLTNDNATTSDSNINIYNCKFDGNKASYTGSNIQLNNITYSTIQNVNSSNSAAHGIRCDDCQYVNYIDTVTVNNDWMGVEFYRTTNSKMVRPIAYDCGEQCIELSTNISNVIVENAYVRDYAGTGIEVWNSTNSNVLIFNPTLIETVNRVSTTGTGGWGIGIHASGVTVLGGSISGIKNETYNTAIWIDQAYALSGYPEGENATVIGTKIYNLPSYAVGVQSRSNGSKIIDVEFYNVTGVPVRLAYSTNNTVKGIKSHEHSTCVAVLLGSSDNIIENNDCSKSENVSSYGITGTGSALRNIIQNNNVKNNGLGGISVYNLDDNIVMNNYGFNGTSHGIRATNPSPFGAGDYFYNTTANTQQVYTGSAWDWLLMSSNVLPGSNVTVTNNGNGTITISSTSSAQDISGLQANDTRHDANITEMRYRTVQLVFDNGSNAIATGLKVPTPRSPINGTIEQVWTEHETVGGAGMNISWLYNESGRPVYPDDVVAYIDGSDFTETTGLSIAVTSGGRVKAYVVSNSGTVNATTIGMRIRVS